MCKDGGNKYGEVYEGYKRVKVEKTGLYFTEGHCSDCTIDLVVYNKVLLVVNL